MKVGISTSEFMSRVFKLIPRCTFIALIPFLSTALYVLPITILSKQVIMHTFPEEYNTSPVEIMAMMQGISRLIVMWSSLFIFIFSNVTLCTLLIYRMYQRTKNFRESSLALALTFGLVDIIVNIFVFQLTFFPGFLVISISLIAIYFFSVSLFQLGRDRNTLLAISLVNSLALLLPLPCLWWF